MNFEQLINVFDKTHRELQLKATGIKGISSTVLKLSSQFYLGYSQISQTLSGQSWLGNTVTKNPYYKRGF